MCGRSKTRECVYGDHIVYGEDADMMGEQTEHGFVCNRHLRLYQNGVDPDAWEGSDENDVDEDESDD